MAAPEDLQFLQHANLENERLRSALNAVRGVTDIIADKYQAR